ncbi:MAG: hypothetical protein IJU32_06260 [Pyramidobacter sp.]|nr:hypothetical protein [Pyramidobacter sp.]
MNADAKTMCTCADKSCPFNPANHDRGCTPCIAKNLAAGEIPSCFFNAVSTSRTPRGYRMEDFAEFILAVSRR